MTEPTPSPDPGTPPSRPAWREPLVWLVFGIPGLTVIAGLATWWLAAQRADSNVAEDWYRQGLTINRALERENRAQAQHIHARLELRPNQTLIATLFAPAPLPTSLSVTLIHPVRAEEDVRVVLSLHPDGVYRVVDPRITPGRWSVSLETQDWRVFERYLVLHANQPVSLPAARDKPRP
jgi:hypothetical protein